MTNAELPEAPIPDAHVGILETALLATVSTISHKDGLISTNPVGFDWDGEYVRLSTLKSRVKYRNLVANPQVTFCAVDPKMSTRYVEIRGYAQISDDPKGTLSTKMFRRMRGKEPDLDEPTAERVIIKICSGDDCCTNRPAVLPATTAPNHHVRQCPTGPVNALACTSFLPANSCATAASNRSTAEFATNASLHINIFWSWPKPTS